jgi:hypothetical protein
MECNIDQNVFFLNDQKCSGFFVFFFRYFYYKMGQGNIVNYSIFVAQRNRHDICGTSLNSLQGLGVWCLTSLSTIFNFI